MVNIKCTLKYISVRVVPKRSYYKINYNVCIYLFERYLCYVYITSRTPMTI